MVTALSIFVIAWIVGQYWFIDYWRSLKKKTISKEIMLAKKQEEDRFNELSSRIEGEFVKISAQMAVTKALVDNLHNENDFLKEKSAEKDNKLIEAQVQYEALRVKNSELSDKVTEAKASNELLNYKNTTLEKESKSKDDEIARLRDEMKDATNAAQANAKSKDDELAKLRNQMKDAANDAQANIKLKDDEIAALKASLSEEEKGNAKHEKEKADLMIKLESLKKELAAKDKSNDNEIAALKKIIEELEEKNKKSAAELEKCNKKLGIFETVFASVKENINEI